MHAAYSQVTGPGVIVKYIMERKVESKIFLSIAVMISAAAGLYVIPDQIAYFVTASKVDAIQHTETADSLLNMYSSLPVFSGKYEVYALAAIAENKHASAELLDDIARKSKPNMHERLHNKFNIARNRMYTYHGISAIRLLAENPSVSSKTLDFLVAISNDDLLLGDIATNSTLSENTLRNLYKKSKRSNDSRIRYNFANNPATPSDIIIELKKK